MKIKEYKNELLGESVFCAKHSSGLEICVCPKENYDSAYALFAVKYGSIDTFIGNEDGSYTAVPEGTAHFLEHKLFESEELDAFELFQKTGASANAYTSFERTAYLFKGSENIEKSLGYLLDFVQKPYFTAETVQKEQGIIGQEIRMYQDLPSWVIMFNALKCLYKNNPIRIDIAGTQESIAKIDDKLLYTIYDTYYNPSNMMLCVVGKVDPEKVFDQVSSSILRKKKKVPPRKFEKEPAKVYKKYIEQKLSVTRKQFMLAYKEPLQVPEITLEDEIATDILCEAVFGQSTPFFKKLIDAKLVEMDFGASTFCGYGYSAVFIEGTSDEHEKVIKEVKAEIARVKKQGISPEAIERARRKIYGRFVMRYNYIDGIANGLTSLYFSGCKPFDEMKVINKITPETVEKRLEIFNESSSAVSVLLPA